MLRPNCEALPVEGFDPDDLGPRDVVGIVLVGSPVEVMEAMRRLSHPPRKPELAFEPGDLDATVQ